MMVVVRWTRVIVLCASGGSDGGEVKHKADSVWCTVVVVVVVAVGSVSAAVHSARGTPLPCISH
ncbi:hypothetical protein E2C01_073489 [Portunus trituberculatus]|uniref:Uncharacterized protein n=1 Tax=Portunus trituberculatus TaxID=210409 RepID=A0A5B7IAP3_PORTR|nr:hypothetical protein [Portunus trituberculatus]